MSEDQVSSDGGRGQERTAPAGHGNAKGRGKDDEQGKEHSQKQVRRPRREPQGKHHQDSQDGNGSGAEHDRASSLRHHAIRV